MKRVSGPNDRCHDPATARIAPVLHPRAPWGARTDLRVSRT